jgi:hypothetical protein
VTCRGRAVAGLGANTFQQDFSGNRKNKANGAVEVRKCCREVADSSAETVKIKKKKRECVLSSLLRKGRH